VSLCRLGVSGLEVAAARLPLLACAIAIVLVAGAAGPVEAQTSQQTRAPRGFRGLFGGTPTPDPNRTREELSLTSSLSAGYDDNLAAAALGGSGTPSGPAAQDGYMGQGQLDLRYYRGRLVRSFTLEGSAYGTGYGDVGVGFVKGGLVNVSGTTRLRTRDRFQASQGFIFDPLFTLNTLSVLDGGSAPSEVPGSNTTTGLTERRSWSSQTGVDYSWAASARNSLNMSYGFGARRYPDGENVPGDSESHRASAGFTRPFNRRVSLNSNYIYTYGRYRDADGVRPLTEHTISGGPQIEKIFSRTRRLQLSAGVGAQYVRTLSGVALRRTMVDYWTPFGDVAAQFDLSRTWDMTVNYRRGTTVLPEVTTDSFVTDGITVGTGGVIGSRLEVQANAGLTTGTTASAAGGQASNQTLTWSSQARWAFNRRIAATVAYDYYKYEFTDTADLPEGFPPGSSRNTFRVGVTIWLPLIGNYVTERSGGRSGRS
jgi:opacity protein-like surface antigen